VLELAAFKTIKGLMSTQYNGKGSAQSGGAASVPTASSSAAGGGGDGSQGMARNISINIAGSSFNASSIRELIGAISEEVGDGVNFTVN
jgi:hypothetical protein